MSKLADLLAELDELNKLDSMIIDRLWKASKESVDLTGRKLTEENIKARVDELADQLVRDFPNGNPVLVGLMDGAVPFASMLCARLNSLNYTYDYTTMSASSYGHGMESGTLHLGVMPKVSLIARNVVVVDDICDTGKTLHAVKEAFLAQHPKLIKLMVLVDKVQDRAKTCDPDYTGFRLNKEAFVIGFGLDFRHSLREKLSIKDANLAMLPSPEEQAKLDRKAEITAEIKVLIALEQEAKKQTALAAHSFFIKTPSAEIPAAATGAVKVECP